MAINPKSMVRALMGAVFAFLLIASAAQPVSAAVYGTGNYGACPYTNGCTAPAPTTVVTPTGLQVSINLTDNQVIPLHGYTITMTPLNGAGSSFKQADIYINSALAQTVTPAADGTASWLWTPATIGKEDVKIIITDTNGDTTTQEFAVQVADQQTTSIAPTTSNPTRAKTVTAPVAKKGFSAVLQSVSNGATAAINKVTRAVKSLPSPVIHSFPYILFFLLGVNVVLALMQAQRELSEYHILHSLLDRATTLNESKKTFVELVSHYLRTPLTIIAGGVDLLAIDKTFPTDTITKLRTVVGRLKNDAELVINQATPIVRSQSATSTAPGSLRIWSQRGLFIPVLLIATSWLIFEYLVGRANTFSVGQVEILTQTFVFTVLVIGLYLLIRQRQLRRRDAFQLNYIIGEETAVGRARDETISTAVETLDGEVKNLDSLTSQLASSIGSKNIKNGQQQVHDIITKFAIASRLHGGQSPSPFVAIDTAQLLDDAGSALQSAAAKKGLTIERSGLGIISVQEPELLAFVLSSLLDNAIAYSHDKGLIKVSAQLSSKTATISVSDHGSGISENKQSLLFQPFSKTEGAEEFNHEGMGFSLYLDKLIMEYLGGSIELTSEPAEGTTVQLHLPQQVPGTVPATTP